MTDPSRPVPWRDALALCGQAGNRPLVQLAVLAVLQAALPVAGLFAMMQLVDAVSNGLADRIPRDQAWDEALLATAIAAGVALAGGVLRSLSTVVSENHGRRLGDVGLQRLQEHAAQLDVAEFDRPGFHDAMQRAGQEAGQRPVRLCQDMTSLLVAVLSLLMMSALLAQVEVWLPVTVGLAAVPIAWARRKHARLRFGWHREHVVPQREVGYLGATLTGRATAKDVRVLGLAEAFGARLRSLRSALRDGLAKLARRRARDELLVHTIASGALFAAYVYLANDALLGGMTLGGLVLHAQAAQRTQNAVRDLLAASTGVHEHRLFLRPLVDFLERRAQSRDDGSHDEAASRAAANGPPAFVADAVHFQYPEIARPVLADLGFSIGPGERVAVLGANGSGKSTLIKLLCGLYGPTSGSLRMDGRPVFAHPPAALRQRIAVLLQDASAFELTLRENLQLGQAQPVSDERLWQVLEVVGLAERVRGLPQGLDTPWSRRLAGGIDWSVGEGRRIVLARTLAQASDVLLLDEPFASLDGKTAAAVAAHLVARDRDQTLVIVDHRGPALGCVDRVIWLHQGRLVRDDTPDALRRDPGFAEQFPEWVDR